MAKKRVRREARKLTHGEHAKRHITRHRDLALLFLASLVVLTFISIGSTMQRPLTGFAGCVPPFTSCGYKCYDPAYFACADLVRSVVCEKGSRACGTACYFPNHQVCIYPTHSLVCMMSEHACKDGGTGAYRCCA